MKKALYWIVLVLGILLIGVTVMTSLYDAAQIANKRPITRVFLVGILDLLLNPLGFLGIILLIGSTFIKKRIPK